METVYSKPRVFLSHSKKNFEFIERLANDLRNCQIEPWIDTVEIRHGKSWQDSIFQYGLPACDAVIVYLTDLSIESPVVKKEMDVALLQGLKDNNVAFLPYVDNEELRVKLRPDIQALQVPEWNNENYSTLLPRVVAEIWRSYLERTVYNAIRDERLKRVQLELEIEKNKRQNNDVFLQSEETEFDFISRNLNKPTKLNINYGNISSLVHFDRDDFNVVFENVHEIEFDLIDLFAKLTSIDKTEYKFVNVKRWIYNEVKPFLSLNKKLVKEIEEKIATTDDDLEFSYRILNIPDILDELRLFGLIETKSVEVEAEIWRDKVDFRFIYTEKFFRYRYWLAYHNNLPNDIKFNIIDLYV